jgi:hypothetical protein
MRVDIEIDYETLRWAAIQAVNQGISRRKFLLNCIEKVKNSGPNIQFIGWIDFQEWKRLKIWRHYKESMIGNLSPFKIHTEEEINNFNEWYKEKYPENYESLNLDKDVKSS